MTHRVLQKKMGSLAWTEDQGSPESVGRYQVLGAVRVSVLLGGKTKGHMNTIRRNESRVRDPVYNHPSVGTP